MNLDGYLRIPERRLFNASAGSGCFDQQASLNGDLRRFGSGVWGMLKP